MAKVYSYIRMSTPEQLKGDSLRRQIEGTQAFAAKHGLEVDEQLRDLGKSAFRGRNTGDGSDLARFLELIESGRVEPGSFLVVESLDRLSRQSVTISFDLLRSIISKGVTVVTLHDSHVYSNDSFNSIAPLLHALMSMVLAHEESRTKSDRVAKAWKQKKLRASKMEVATKRVPAWLRWTEEGIVVVEERAVLVRDIFEKLRDGWGAYSIARDLNKKGVTAWGTRHRAVWRESYIKKMLHGRTVLGEYHPHKLVFEDDVTRRVPDGEPIVGYYPAVVDETLYEEAQAAVARRRTTGRGRKGPSLANLFTGLLKCGACGAGMMYIDKGAPPKGGKYLRCSVAQAGGRKCSARAWRYELVETALLSSIDELDVSYILEGRSKDLVRSDLQERVKRIDDEMEMYEKRLARADEFIRLTSTPLNFLVANSNEDVKQLNEAKIRKGEIEKKIIELENFDEHARRQRLDELLIAIGVNADDDRRVETRRALAAELRRSLSKILVQACKRSVFEVRTGGPADPIDDDPEKTLTDQPPEAWLSEYGDLSNDELQKLFDQLDFEFIFVYRNGREHHIDPVTRRATTVPMSNKFDLFKEAIRLRDTERRN